MFNAKILILLTVALIGSVSAEIVNNTKANVNEICSLMPRNSVILRPNSCTNWVKCPSSLDTNDYEEGSCVMGLYYNKDTGRCQFSEEVVCPYVVEEKNVCLKKADGTFVADPHNCNAYIFCKAGKEQHSTCPNDLVFDPKQSACVYKNEYKCTAQVEKSNGTPICRSVGNNVLFANEHVCTQYHECDEDNLKTYECSDDMAFDHKMGRCVEQANAVCAPNAKLPEPASKICGTSKENARVGYFTDEKSCSGYYACSKQTDGTPDPKPQRLECQQGFFFDASMWSCRDRVNVRCHLDRCEGMGNKYVNVAGDCTSYARCKNGATLNTGTCPENYFFDERTQGCTPHNISYAACAA